MTSGFNILTATNVKEPVEGLVHSALNTTPKDPLPNSDTAFISDLSMRQMREELLEEEEVGVLDLLPESLDEEASFPVNKLLFIALLDNKGLTG